MEARRPPQIFSQRRRRQALRRALVRQSDRDAARFVLRDMVEDVLERLEFIRCEPTRALVVGDWTGTLALSLSGRGADVVEHDVRTLDEEEPLSGGPYDLIVNLASLDRVNDLPGALIHARKALATEGLFLASLLGAGSLQRLRTAMLAAEPDRPQPRMHPLVSDEAATGLLQRAGFARQVVDSRTMTVSYAALDKLVADLRDQGFGNALAKIGTPLPKRAHEFASSAFLEDADDTGRVLETFEILTLTGWRD